MHSFSESDEILENFQISIDPIFFLLQLDFILFFCIHFNFNFVRFLLLTLTMVASKYFLDAQASLAPTPVPPSIGRLHSVSVSEPSQSVENLR